MSFILQVFCFAAMAVLLKRLYLSKKHQIMVFGILLMFMIYYAIKYNTPETLENLDFTKKNKDKHMVLEHIKAQVIAKPPDKITQNQLTSPKELKLAENTTLTSKTTLTSQSKLQTQPSQPKIEAGSIIENREEVNEYIENTLQDALKEDKGTGCDIPKLDPFSKEVTQFAKEYDPIKCDGKDWVKCYMSTCRVDPEVLISLRNVKCTYKDIIYDSDNYRHLGPATVIEGDGVYVLTNSDHVKISCTADSVDLRSYLKPGSSFSFTSPKWSGHGIGFRTTVKPKTPPLGRENTINVLIFGFDSTSKNGFIRKMPKSYKVLKEELKFNFLDGYNIVGDGTPASLFPILTGKTELELPESRKSIPNSGHLDSMPFIFYKLKEDGYRTAYFEDMPWIGTFQYRFRGFRKQPADHYLRAFFLEESQDGRSWSGQGFAPYCVGDTPRYKLMINITDQFLKLDGKRYVFTFIADITHDDFNMISSADDATTEFLRGLKSQGRLEDTIVLVMGDHGPRYSNVRGTFQGKLEERLPLMAIHLPEVLKQRRPHAQAALESNVDVLTTPHDIYATILDAIDMTQHWNPYKLKGADLPRGLTLLEPISRNRSCSEAGIEPHWCTCLRWENLSPSDARYKRAAQALVDHINSITEPMREKCALRTLTSIRWVMKRKANQRMIDFQGAKDADGYVGKFKGGKMSMSKIVLQVKITVGPGEGDYEASVSYLTAEDKFHVNPREISRTNAYNKEPSCISAKYPHLNMYCYCKNNS